MKTCSRCRIPQDDQSFYRNNARPDGLSVYCKTCHKIDSHRYRHSVHGKKKTRERGRTLDGRLLRQQKSRRYRERKYDLDFVLSLGDVNKIYERFKYKCFNCGSGQRLQIDHHYPLSRGYGLSLTNAVVLCYTCNAGKCDKLPEDFYTEDKLKALSVLLTGSI